MSSVRLQDMTWLEAEKVLNEDSVVVVPIGAASKEHGPHLPLGNDLRLAEELASRVMTRVDAVFAPTVNYHFYPAFAEYPGSTSLRLETARDLLVDLCESLARFGPTRFYALNTGVSTIRALEATSQVLAKQNIRFRYTNILEALEPIEKEVAEQEGGTHADEVETSMMLYLAPDTVDMSKAVKDYDPTPGGLSRVPATDKSYSPSGVFGDPTLATSEKGQLFVDALLEQMRLDIEDLFAEG